ncbi:helix-turn-helix domain-containing protein [Amycolatopsis keratiniphila]|uniref:nSTAND1 domain-containing NTPase n=1 Tax=Amycolatopsis keratiniphila TaxID=129921 RepID=UPI0033F4D716
MARRERPLDVGDDVVLAFAADLRRLRERAGSPPYRELSRRAHYSAGTLSDAANGRKLPSLAVTLAYVRACGGDPVAWQARWHELATLPRPDDDVDTTAASEGGLAPYAGLSSLGPEDADRFCGRDRLLERLERTVRDHRLVVVVGASGAGKSSLLRAGLVPAAGCGALAGGCSWATQVFTPGPRPLHAFTAVLNDSAAVLGEQGGCRVDGVTGHSDVSEVLLVVDQFEEVFTLCQDDRERDRFVDRVVATPLDSDSRIRVVIGVRADFYGHCVRYPALAAALQDAQVLVGPMSVDELRQVITEPAVKAGYRVENALVARLVAEATGQAGALPLLSHALLETWRRRHGTTLTLVAYESTGGIQHALAQTAESVYTALTPSQQARAQQVFGRLVALGEGTGDTKRRVPRDELDSDDDTAVVLERLAAARLLVLDEHGIELTHEALIRSWPRLRDWLDGDRDGLRLHRSLTSATDTWESHGRDDEAVYRGARLDAAEDFAATHPLTERESRFLAASRAVRDRDRATARRRTRRLRQLVALLSVLLIVAVTAIGAAVRGSAIVTEQRNDALSRNAAFQATALRTADPPLAAQLGLAAYRLAPTTEARSSLLSTFATPYAIKLDDSFGRFENGQFSPDGRLAAVGGERAEVKVYDLTVPRRPTRLATIPGLGASVVAVAFSPDGRLLGAVGTDGSLRLWDMADPRRPVPLATVTAHTGTAYGVAFAAQGRLLATAGSDQLVRVWDLADPRQPTALATLAGHTDVVGQVAFSPDGRWLASASEDDTAGLWDVTDPHRPQRRAALTAHHDNVESVAFSPDGRVLATAGYDHRVRLWSLDNPAAPVQLAALTGHDDIVTSVAFAPDGRTIAAGGGDHTVRLWNITEPRSPQSMTALTGHTGAIRSVAFGPHGHTVLSTSADQTVQLTDQPGPVLSGHAGSLNAIALSADGRIAAVGAENGTAHVWDLADPFHPIARATLTGHTGPILATAMKSTLLATGSVDKTVRLWTLTDPAHPTALPRAIPHGGTVRALAFHPRAAMVAVAGDEQIVRLWDLTDPAQPRLRAELPGLTDAIPAIAFSPDGRTLAAAATHSVWLYDLIDPQRPARLVEIAGHTNRVSAVAFNPDGHTLATASLDRTARLWNVTARQSPEPLATLTGHTDAVAAVVFSPDGRTLATAGHDLTARLWNVTDLRAPTRPTVLSGHVARLHALAFHPGGHLLLTAGQDHDGRIWHTDPQQVTDRICATARGAITQTEWEQSFPGIDYQPPCR